MGKNSEKNHFGLSASVGSHMAILKVLAKNDNEAISVFWKSNSADIGAKKTMLFHTLAMLDPKRLHAWIESTPQAWWSQDNSKPTTKKKPWLTSVHFCSAWPHDRDQTKKEVHSKLVSESNRSP